jgi:hypothetical protein
MATTLFFAPAAEDGKRKSTPATSMRSAGGSSPGNV